MTINEIQPSILMVTKITFLLLLIVLISCNNETNPNQYSTGRIIHKDWYDSGKLESVVWYNQDLKEDSIGLWYYENGNLKISAHFSDGKQTGPSTYYYPNGNVEMYCYYNHTGDGSVMYVEEFDEKGDITKKRGMPIGVVYENGLRVTPGNYFYFTVVTVTPPNNRVKVYTSLKENTPEFVSMMTYEVKDKMPFLRHYFETKGEYPMRVVSELNDTVRNVIRRDTINFTVTVD